MYDDAPFLILSTISTIAVMGTFAALLWAAVQDGRDERAFRASGSRRPAVPSSRVVDPAR